MSDLSTFQAILGKVVIFGRIYIMKVGNTTTSLILIYSSVISMELMTACFFIISNSGNGNRLSSLVTPILAIRVCSLVT